MPPGGFDDDFTLDIFDVAETAELAWWRFCYPALRRDAYEAEGFAPVTVIVEVHPPKSRPASA